MGRSEKCYLARIINWQGINLVNVCDKELIGKTFKDEKIEICISPDYFKGELVSIEEALVLIKSSSVANLAGEKIIIEVIKAKLASKQAVKKIGTTSFLMIFKFS
ncbi:MAG: DUF424 family protein [Candidatus Methylarchaceae archaeon HK02M2]|nr:DUF424 family protein [Candidatus Methylarchaceae archaeon HK02M2]